MGTDDRQQQAQKSTSESSRCELCKQRASVFCPWDEAKLCDLCDAKVHSANFLVTRHTRHVLCPCCGAPALHSPQTGPRIEPRRLQEVCAECRLRTTACQPQDADAFSSAESCCITSVHDDEQDCGSSWVLSSRSPPLWPLSTPEQVRWLTRSTKCTTATCAVMTLVNTQDEGLGDSEDCSYGFSLSPG